MGFSTNIFLFMFLPLFLLIYMISNTRCRPFILLFFSAVFYIWGSTKGFAIIILFSVFNYFAGFLIARTAGKKKRCVLGVSVCLNLALLFYFKYTDFLLGTVNRIWGGNLEITFLQMVFPLGISYYSFSSISYLVDIYRETIRCEKNFLKFLLYMLMFPKITAGPILRYKDISSQLLCDHVTLERSTEGAKRFCIGLAKKVLIADQLGTVADQIFSVPASEHLVSTAWLGAICYMLQIYHDFSGYSDMAIGLGKICGFDFSENFNYPYISKSMTEFWRRWHISLSSWFRDYLYIPLGGNRRGNVYFNLFIVFLATGLWHGGEWHFVLWGVWNGIFILFEKLASRHCQIAILTGLKRLYTLLVVMFGWILFRSDSVSAGIQYILKLFGVGSTRAGFTFLWYLSPKLVGIILIGILGCIPWKKKEEKKYVGFHYCLCILLLLISIVVIMSSTYNSFIYFRF